MARNDEWKLHGLCAADPELSFPPGATWDGHRAQAERAIRICQACPVRDQCLEDYLEAGDRFAIAGATTPRTRRRMLALADIDTDACGTYPKGWLRHRRHGEKPCDDCRLAANDYQRRRRAAAKASTTQTAAASR